MSNSNTVNSNDLPIVADLVAVKTTFVDGFQGYSTDGNTAKIGLFEIKQDFSDPTNPNAVKKVIVGHLAMSHETLFQLYKWLGDITGKAPKSASDDAS